jgi:hypothetical protein
LSFPTFSFNDSEFNLFFLSMANASNNCPSATGSFPRRALKRSAFLLVLASRQRWPEKLCRWLLMAAVASPWVQE